MSTLQVLSILKGGVTLILIAVGFYWDHHKPIRSEVKLQAQAFSGSGFQAGSKDIWPGISRLKLTNSGGKTDLLADHRVAIDHLYKSPTSATEKRRDEPPCDLEVYVSRHADQLPEDRRVQPEDVVPGEQSLRIEPTDILSEYDAVAVEHHFIVEDDQREYDVRFINRMGLSG